MDEDTIFTFREVPGSIQIYIQDGTLVSRLGEESEKVVYETAKKLGITYDQAFTFIIDQSASKILGRKPRINPKRKLTKNDIEILSHEVAIMSPEEDDALEEAIRRCNSYQ